MLPKIILTLILPLSFLTLWDLGLLTQRFSAQEQKTWLTTRQDQLQSQSTPLANLARPDFKIHDLSLVYIGPGEKYWSRFGHLLLQLHNDQEPIAIGFLPDINQPFNSIIRAIFGGYSVLLDVQTITAQRHHYVDIQKRSWTSYPLVSTPQQRLQLLTHLKTWLTDPDRMGSYQFFTNSCVMNLHRLMEKSGFKVPRQPSMFAHRMPQQWQETGMIRSKAVVLKGTLGDQKYSN